MSGQPYEGSIVNLLAEHEVAVGRLYRTYAGKFPQCRDFWASLADEEDQHAKWLQRLLVRVEEGLGCVRPDRFDSSAVRASIQRIEQMIKQAERPDFSRAEALSAALALEETLLECKYFEVFEGTAAEVVQVQYFLAGALEDHCRRIQEAMLPPS